MYLAYLTMSRQVARSSAAIAFCKALSASARKSWLAARDCSASLVAPAACFFKAAADDSTTEICAVHFRTSELILEVENRCTFIATDSQTGAMEKPILTEGKSDSGGPLPLQNCLNLCENWQPRSPFCTCAGAQRLYKLGITSRPKGMFD
jgi:hypothetical protein